MQNDVSLKCCKISDDLWPLRQTQIIIRSLIPKIWSFPATPALKKTTYIPQSTL